MRPHEYRSLCAFSAVIVTSLKKVGIGHCCIHFENERVAGAQAQRVREVLYRGLRLAELELNPPANVPGSCQVTIAQQSLLNQSGAAIRIAGKRGDCMCSS